MEFVKLTNASGPIILALADIEIVSTNPDGGSQIRTRNDDLYIFEVDESVEVIYSMLKASSWTR